MPNRPLIVALILLGIGGVVGWALPHPSPAAEPLLAGPICGPVRRGEAPPDCDVERHDRCWDTLADRLAPHPTTTVGFEAAVDIEQPDAFVPAVEAEVARCDPGAVVEVTDCSSYPCVAAVRPSMDWLADDCRWDDTRDANVVVLPLDVDCPGGTERMYFTTLVDESSARAALGLGEDEPPNGLLAGLVGQRVDTLLEMWPCAGS